MKYETVIFLFNYVTRFPENQSESESESRIVRLIGNRFLGWSAWLRHQPTDYRLYSIIRTPLLDIFNNYLRLRSTTTPTGKLHGDLSKCIYNIIFKSPFNYCYIAIQSVYACICFYFSYSKTNISNSFSF